MQKQVRVHSDQGTQQAADLPDSHHQMRSFAGPRAQFSDAQARSWITDPFTVESVFQPHLTRRAGNSSWKQCGPVALKLRRRQAELITPRAKSVPGVEHSQAMHG